MHIEDIKIKHSKRNKRIVVRVIEGELIATVPYNISNQEVYKLLHKDKKKLEKFIQKVSTKIREKVDVLYEGYEIQFLGKNYKIKFAENVNKPTIESDYILIENRFREQWKPIFKKWYKEQAETYFNKLLLQYSKIMGLKYSYMRLSDAKSKWGSCSRKNHRIILVWRLIMAPPWVIKYIIVHELAHIRHPNHQAEFWAFVKRFYPNYKDAEKWLKENGNNLFI